MDEPKRPNLIENSKYPISVYYLIEYWQKVGIGVVVVGSIAWLALEYRALRRLQSGILAAREGLLDQVPETALGWGPGRRTVTEYNVTIAALQSMFRSVDECQRHFISQRNRMNTLLQSLPGTLFNLSEDLQIISVNKSAEEMFSCSSEQLIGINLFDLLHLNDNDRELLRDAFLYKQSIRNQEISLVNQKGQRFYSLNLGFYNDEDNDLGGVLILQDVSEHRHLQDSIALREKLVAMGQLAAGVAHELNTPLGNILGYAQLLSRTQEDQGKFDEYTSIIIDETRRCSNIVHNLLNYAREEHCSGETCDLNQLITELIETFLTCRMKRYNIDVRLMLCEGPLVVEGDCGQLDIVLSNLLTNAIHALDNVSQPVITITSRIDGGHGEVAVADNGPGVAPKYRHKIFDPFFTTKDVGQGSGLGLPISHAILAKRGGFIMYDNEYQDGARFLIKLPAVDLRRTELSAPTESTPVILT